MSAPNHGESQNRRAETSSGSGHGFLWALGGVALAGAGVAALLYFTNEKENESTPKVTLVEDRLREHVREIFRTRNISEETCSICLESLKKKESPSHQCIMLQCGHVYHQPCIEAWLQTQERDGQSPNCPACRAPSVMMTTPVSIVA